MLIFPNVGIDRTITTQGVLHDAEYKAQRIGDTEGTGTDARDRAA
jgi:hypothetical protein